MSSKTRTATLRTIETFAIGAAGGMLFWWLGLPGGQLTGSMIAVAIASLGGRALMMPRLLLNVMMTVLGITLGSAVSPEMLQSLPAYAASLVLLVICTAAVVTACALYLIHVHGWDKLSALLGATPGSFGQIMVMTIESRSDEVGVAVVQSLRVIAVALLTPLFLVFAGFSADRAGFARPVAGTFEIALLFAAAIPLGWFCQWRRFPAPWLFGPMLASGVLHGLGYVHGGLPSLPVNIAMIGIGSIVGTRFAGVSAAAFMRYLGAGLGSMLVAFAVTAVFGAAAIYFLPVKPAEVFVAFAPGALDAMMALSLALHLDPLFVGAHHMLRFLQIAFFAPIVAKLVAPKAPIDEITAAHADDPENLED